MKILNAAQVLIGTGETTVKKRCPFCGKDHGVRMTLKSFRLWQSGTLLQNAAPYLNADNREVLISGTCASCWDKTFG